MLERFTQRARTVLGFAEQEAQLLGHMYIGTEHLLLGLLREHEGVAARALGSLDVTPDGVRKQVESIVGYGISGTSLPKRLTPRSSRALDRASRESSRLGHSYISTEHILLGVAQEDEGVAVRVLSNLGVNGKSIRDQVFRTLGYSPQSFESEATRSSSKTPPPSAARVSNETANNDEPIQLFYSYSHKDEKLRQQLETHLSTLRRQGLISEWHDRKIIAGHEWDGEIDQNLEAAGVILLLVSPDFVASDYCYEKELKRALEKHEQGQACVIPIILRPTHWEDTPFSKLQALPEGIKPVTKWTHRDEAWLNVTKGIHKAVNELRERRSGV